MEEERMLNDEILLGLIKSNSGGGGGTSDYEQLSNLPKIDGVELKGNKTAAQLGLATEQDLSGKQNALTAGDYIQFEGNEISVKRTLDVPTYVYNIKTPQHPYLVITKTLNGEQVSQTTYSYNGSTQQWTIDDLFTLKSYRNSSDVASWRIELISDAHEHDAGWAQEWDTNVYGQTGGVYDFDLTFDTIDVSGQTLVIKSEMDTALSGKQNTLTFDDAPTDGSNNPVKSNGVYDALALKQNATDNNLETTSKTVVGAVNELKSGLTTLDNEVNGDAVEYPYADVITIEDAIPANVADCKVKIEPVQDLHGYDHPWVGGAGKNKLPMTVDGIKAANTTGTWSSNAYTINDVTFTVQTDDDGNVTGIKVNGTASAETLFILPTPTLSTSTSYILNGTPSGMSGISALYVQVDGAIKYDNGEGVSFTVTSTVNAIRILVVNGQNVQNKTFYPMLRLSTETDATFAPYTNICPISGHTEASVQRDGKNLFPSNNAFVVSNDGDMVEFATKGNTEYIISMLLSRKSGVTITNDSINTFVAQEYDANNAMVKQWGSGSKYLPSGSTDVSWSKSFTTDSRTVSIKLYLGNNNGDFNANTIKSNIQVELGSSATDYEPYKGKATATITFGQTVYGGSVDFKTGKVTGTDSEYDLGDLTWAYDQNNHYFFATAPSTIKLPSDNDSAINGVCSIYPVASMSNILAQSDDAIGVSASGYVVVKDARYTDATAFDSAVTGQKLVCELATPTTIQLTPQQIQLLKGQNTLTASTGQISVTANGVSGSIGSVQEQIDDLQGQVAEVQSNLTSLHIHKVVESLTTGTVSDKLLSLKTAYNNLTADQRKTAILVKNDQDQYIPLNNTGEFFVVFVNMSTTLFITINIQNGTSIIEQDGTKSDQSSLTNSDKYSIWVME